MFVGCLQIQKMVISGGDFKPDTLKAKDMVSLLLHDDEMETRCECYPHTILCSGNMYATGYQFVCV